MPAPCVLATSAGWTWSSSSCGSRPASAKASTVAARFTSAIRSAVAIRSFGTPKRARSRPVGSWPATRRVCATIARDADLAADRDVEAVAVAAHFAAVRARLVLGVDGERDRLLERDRREHGVAVRVDRAVGFQRAHADALRHRVGVARVQVLLAHLFLAWRCRSSGRGSARARS